MPIIPADRLLAKAIQAHQKGDLLEAEPLYRKVLKARPGDPFALHHLGIIHYGRGEMQQASDLIHQALAAKPDFPEALNNMGNVLRAMGRHDEALASYQESLRLREDPGAYNNLGGAYQDLRRFPESDAAFKRAIELDPHYAEAYYNIAIGLRERGDFDQSMAFYRKSTEANPRLAEAYVNIGNLLGDQRRFDEAAAEYRTAIELRPDFAEAHNNLGNILQHGGDLSAAERCYRLAAQYKPKYVDAHVNLGITLASLGRREEALQSFLTALELDPNHSSALSNLFFDQRHLCDWRNFSERENALRSLVRERQGRIGPFAFLTLSSTAEEQLDCARTWAQAVAASVPPGIRLSPPSRRVRDKIRVGYLSADFHTHATAFLMAELFERHNRDRFEIYGYSIGPEDDSEMRKRLVKAFDRFVDLRTTPHEQAAQIIAADEVDILIDLKGYTQHARTEILAFRPAPIQVNYLGYPGTMGADFIDYLIADAHIVPPEHQAHYTEKLVYLPNCYQPNDTKREIAPRVITRADCGLPEQGFVFCSFNNSYKITPAIFDVWMRLLKAEPGSVLWLLEAGKESVRENLRREAETRGVDPNRLVFGPGLPLAEHLARHRCADLFLDTLPVNAHTTASDALWAGLPVVTISGDTFVSRVAGSLLKAVGLPQLVTYTLEDYEALALQLARSPLELADIKRRLAENKLTMPLFDIARFTADLEAAYEGMWQRWLAGEPPASFAVDSQSSQSGLPRSQSATTAMPASVLPVEPVTVATAPQAALRRPYAACPICEGGEGVVFGQVDCSHHPQHLPVLPARLEWRRCPHCDHVYSADYLTPEAVALLRQKHSVPGYEPEGMRRLLTPVVDRIAGLVEPGDWLDVDPSDEYLMLTAAEWGFRPLALCGGADDEAVFQRHGLDTWFGAIEDLPGTGRFQVISLAHVLQLKPFPHTVLRAARRLLRPGGALFLSVPNRASRFWQMLDEKQENPYWLEFTHAHQFSRKTVYGLLEDHGFRVKGFAASSRYRFGIEIFAVSNGIA